MKAQEYVVLVPVKPPAVGKSRLVGLPDGPRRELAAAFALDTVSACLATPGVGAVTGGHRRRGVRTTPGRRSAATCCPTAPPAT